MSYSFSSLKRYSNYSNLHKSVLTSFYEIDSTEDTLTAFEIIHQSGWQNILYESLFVYKATKDIEYSSQHIFRSMRIKTGLKLSRLKKLLDLGRTIIELTNEDFDSHSEIFDIPSATLEYSLSGKVNTRDYIRFAYQIIKDSDSLTHRYIHKKWCRQNGSIKDNLDIIKPSDWWAFSRPKWQKDGDFDGSIPGEIYANCLYHYCPDEAIIVDSMAGSGMIKKVVDEKQRWIRNRKVDWTLHCYDKFPKREFIIKHDARFKLPVNVDFIFIDPPYFIQSKKYYDGEMAKLDNYEEYKSYLDEIVRASYDSLKSGGRLAILIPKWNGSKQTVNINIPYHVLNSCMSFGFTWIDTVYVSRGKQQIKRAAFLNQSAKEERNPFSDTCELIIIQK